MLSQEKFISGMEILKAAYIDFKFDTNNEMQVKVWYSVFKNMSDEAFIKMIKGYYPINQHPPKCPRDLTVIIVDEIVSTAKIKPENALNRVREIISNRGGWEYEGRAEIYQDLKKYPALSETVHEFEADLRRMSADDTYTADRFRRAYEVRLRTNAIKQVDTALGLNIPDEKKLLPGFLDYEQ